MTVKTHKISSRSAIKINDPSHKIQVKLGDPWPTIMSYTYSIEYVQVEHMVQVALCEDLPINVLKDNSNLGTIALR